MAIIKHNRKGQTALEYLLMVVVALTIVTAVSQFIMSTSSNAIESADEQVTALLLAGGNSCGDDHIDSPEVCDGTDLDGMTCSDFGYSSGTLRCKDSCAAFDKSSCRN